MNQKIQAKIEQYKKMAQKGAANTVGSAASLGARPQRADGLSKVIRSKKEADTFMAELNCVIKGTRI